MNIQRKRVFTLCIAVFIYLTLSGIALAGVLNLELVRTSKYSRTDFDQAFMMVWSGDVKYSGKTVGYFTAVVTKTTLTGKNGSVTQYDLVIPGRGPIGEFISIRTNHIVTGSGSDHGVVFAASPAYKFLIGAVVKMAGVKVRITWPASKFPSTSPFYKK
jgi:hypothetical protein